MLARVTPAELARISRIRAEFRPSRPLAFELQRRGYAAPGWFCARARFTSNTSQQKGFFTDDSYVSHILPMPRAATWSASVCAEQITWNGVNLVEHPTSAAGIRSSGRKVCHASGFTRKGVTTLDTDIKRARDRAEAAFKKKDQQLREGQQAMAEYQAARAATREKTAR